MDPQYEDDAHFVLLCRLHVRVNVNILIAR
jgi:hypothetical protein